MGTMNMLGWPCESSISNGFDIGSVRDPEVHPQVEEYWGNANYIAPATTKANGSLKLLP